MNNDLLAGILVGLPGELPVSTSKNSKNTSDSGSFMLLLRDRLADEATAGMTGEVASKRKNYSVSGANDFNPFLSSRIDALDNRARNDQFQAVDRENSWSTKAAETSNRSSSQDREVESRSEDRAETARQDASDKASAGKERDKTAETEAEEDLTSISADESSIVSVDASSEAAAALAAATEGSENVAVKAGDESDLTVTNSQQTLAAELARIEEMFGALSPEDKAALIETLQQLSPEDLELVAESSGEFCQKLSELVSEMPDSAEKDKLQEMVESPEFLQMMQALSAQNSNTASSDPTSLAAAQKATETRATANSVTDKAATVQQSADSNAAASPETAENASSATEQDQTDRKETAKNTSDKNVDTHQKPVTLEQEGGKESLREEFKRLNQLSANSSTENQQPATTEESALASKPVNPGTVAPTVTPEQAKTAIEEAAKKFFTLFNEKAAGSDRVTTAETYSPEAIKRHSGMNNNSAGNGGNGFSSHTGTPASSMSAARPATPVPAANQIFSQMLEKAEYLKTQNGSKVLNMEFDPGELGKLEMELTSRDGTVSARISAESALAKAQLEELAPQIKEQLLNQGVNLTEITVDISSRNPDESNRDQMSGGKGKSSRFQAAEKEAAEAIIRKNILPNLRRAALNIKAVDLTV